MPDVRTPRPGGGNPPDVPDLAAIRERDRLCGQPSPPSDSIVFSRTELTARGRCT